MNKKSRGYSAEYVTSDDVMVVVWKDNNAVSATSTLVGIGRSRGCQETAIDAVDAFLCGIGLTFSASKTEALLVHPQASTRFSTSRLSLRGLPIEWSKKVRYLGGDH
ncbi:hypothetical protein MTO96_052196 [Rhipicephalus appendiculatus]